MNRSTSSTGLTPFTSAVAIEAALRELETKNSEESSAAIAALALGVKCFNSHLPALTAYRMNEAVAAVLNKSEKAFREHFSHTPHNINSAANPLPASENKTNA